MRVRGVLVEMIRKEALKEIGEIKIAIGEIKILDTVKAGTIAVLAIVARVAREATSTAAAKEATNMEVGGDHYILYLCCGSTTIAQCANKSQAWVQYVQRCFHMPD